MSPKQRDYLHGPKKMISLTIHRNAMQSTFKGKSKAPSCADCRKSKCERIGTKWEIVCMLKHALTPQTCPDFRDARQNLNPNYLLGMGNVGG
jgi:hypothetical protein